MENVNQDEFYARYYITDDGTIKWQFIAEHLREVANLAYLALKDVDDILAKWAKLAGYFHDYGKFNPLFQRRLEEACKKEQSQLNAKTAQERAIADKMTVRKAPHAQLGMDGVVEYLMNKEEVLNREWDELSYKMLSFSILAHHAGLADKVEADEQIDLEIYEQFMTEINDDLVDLTAHLKDFTPRLQARAETKDAQNSQLGFDAMMAVRLIFSALVSSDHLASAQFTVNYEGEVSFASVSQIKEHFLVEYQRFLASRTSASSGDATANKLQQKRSEVYQQCVEMAKENPGIFSLTVPTGGGKTLSSLAFALHHAEKHHQNRIIYVAPFTSILDQTVEIYQHYVGKENLFAHYSTYDADQFNENKAESYQPLINTLSESWQQPVILTTAVQFWESLFTNKPSKAKKIHHIANSVIILDEIQSIPRKYLAPILYMMRTLVQYGCSVVLCSATQPQFDAPQLKNLALQEIQEMILNPQHLADDLERVKVHLIAEPKRVEQVAKEIIDYPQALIILNLRDSATKVYQAIRHQTEDKGCVFHLSGLMTVAHRQEILKKVKEDYLAHGKSCYLVSTSLIEAGVDIDFPVVYREEAGLENLIQSAGRCNREFILAYGTFVVFALDGIKMHAMYKEQHAVYQQIRDAYGDRIFHLDAIRAYYQEIYQNNNSGVKEVGGNPLDVQDIELKSRVVGRNLSSGTDLSNMPFATISKHFNFITDNQWTIIIPYHSDVVKWVDYIEEYGLSGKYLRKLAPYSVGVYRNHYEELCNKRSIRQLVDKEGNGLELYYLEPNVYGNAYDERLGLLKEVSEVISGDNVVYF